MITSNTLLSHHTALPEREVKRKGALNPEAACRSAVFKKEDEIKEVFSVVLVVEWSVVPGQKHFKQARTVNRIYGNGDELVFIHSKYV